MKLRFGCIIVTYRCNAECLMCNTWKFPTKSSREIEPALLEKLPRLQSVNITGGEPFLRSDLDEIVSILEKKANRVVISSNGFFTSRILDLFRMHPNIGIRISLEGLPATNDKLRGIPNGFDRGLRTLIELKERRVKDIGFGITLSDTNVGDLLTLYNLSKQLGLEFATAAIHNSFYFHKEDNQFKEPENAVRQIEKLIEKLLKSRRPKDWFRGYFNYGLINYIWGRERLLPCEMGHDSFFLDPSGEILPCNVLNQSMGNLCDDDFITIWNSRRAEEVRSNARNCGKNCWMVGSVQQQMKKNIWIPIKWIAAKKLKLFIGRK